MMATPFIPESPSAGGTLTPGGSNRESGGTRFSFPPAQRDMMQEIQNQEDEENKGEPNLAAANEDKEPSETSE